MKPGCTCDGTHAEIQQEPPTQGSRRLSLFQLLFSYVLTCEKEVRSGSDLSLGLLAIHVALDSQSLKCDHQDCGHAPSHVHGGLPDRGGDLRLTVCILPAVGGGVQNIVGGGTHGLHGGCGLVGDVVGDGGGSQHGIVAVTDLLITVLVAVAAEIIGQDEALEAPLVTEHGVQQNVVATGIGVADVVEGAHHGLCAAFLHAHLERA